MKDLIFFLVILVSVVKTQVQHPSYNSHEYNPSPSLESGIRRHQNRPLKEKKNHPSPVLSSSSELNCMGEMEYNKKSLSSLFPSK